MHDMQSMYEDEKMKAIEDLLDQMYALIGKGKGDEPVKESEMSASESGQDKPIMMEEENGKEEEASEESPTLAEMLRDYMEGPKRPSKGPSATIMMASMKKPIKKMK